MILLSYSKERLEALYEELHKARRQGKAHLVRVALALILIGEEKYTLQEVAKISNVTVKTLFNWLKKFMARGLKLFTMPWFQGRGRKSKLSKLEQKELYKIIKEGPLAHGFNCGGWNTAMIKQLIIIKFSVSYNERYLPRLLKKIGLSYQKARFVSSRLDEKEHKAAREKWINKTLPEIMEKAKKGDVIVLFGDEVSFAMWGSLGRTWAPIGKQPEVKTTGIRKGLKMYGAINVMEGDFHYRESLQYCLTQKSFTALKKAGMPIEEVKVLKASMNKEKYPTLNAFQDALRSCLEVDVFNAHRDNMVQLAETSGRFNGESYVEFLKQLIRENDKPLILIEDGAPYHGSKVVKEFLKTESKQLRLERLPSFSPDYNPIEKLWKNTKRDATHLKYFERFEDLRESVTNTFKSYVEDAAKVLCVMSKMREEFALTD